MYRELIGMGPKEMTKVGSFYAFETNNESGKH